MNCPKCNIGELKSSDSRLSNLYGDLMKIHLLLICNNDECGVKWFTVLEEQK